MSYVRREEVELERSRQGYLKRVLIPIMFLCAMLFLGMLARAFTLLDPQTWPSALDPHDWPFDLFPVPEVATNPNGGVTYGVLLAFLFKDQQNPFFEAGRVFHAMSGDLFEALHPVGGIGFRGIAEPFVVGLRRCRVRR
jgi:hypothetical protein